METTQRIYVNVTIHKAPVETHNKIHSIRELRELTHMSLIDAKTFIESPVGTTIECIAYADFNDVIQFGTLLHHVTIAPYCTNPEQRKLFLEQLKNIAVSAALADDLNVATDILEVLKKYNVHN